MTLASIAKRATATAALLAATAASLASAQLQNAAGSNVNLPGDLAIDVASVCTPCKPHAASLLQTRIAMLQLEAAMQETMQQLTRVYSAPYLEAELAKVPAGSSEAQRLHGELEQTKAVEKRYRDQSAAMLELRVQAAAFEKLLRECLARCQPAAPPPGKSAPPPAGGKAVVKPSAPGVSVVVLPTGGVNVGQTDYLREESFQIDVRIAGPNPPKSVTVQIFGPDGKVKDLTLDATGAGSYLSPPMTARGDLEGMVEKYSTTVAQGTPYTMTVNGVSTTINVYSTATKVEIGHNAQVMEEVRQALTNIVTGATNALNQLQGAPASPETDALRKKLEDAKAQAEGKLAWMKQYDEQMEHLRKEGFGDHYVVVWQREYLMLLQQNPLLTNGYPPDWFGRYTADKISQQLNVIMKGVYKDLALEIYQLAVGATLDAVLPITPMFTLLTGKDIYGEQVDLEGMKHAATGLAVQGSMLGLQVGLNRCMAPIKGKPTGDLPAMSSEQQAKIRQQTKAEIGAIKKAGQLEKNALDDNVKAQRTKGVVHDLDVQTEAARAAGVPTETIDRILSEAHAEYEAVNGGDLGDLAFAKAALELIEQRFPLEQPGSTLVTGLDDQLLLSSVKAKSFLEMQGEKQVWTTAESRLLNDLAGRSEQALYDIWELEDVVDFNPGKVQEEVIASGGISPVFNEASNDYAAIQAAGSKAASGELSIVDVPLDPRFQAKLAEFRAKQVAADMKGPGLDALNQNAPPADGAAPADLPVKKAKSPFEFSPIDVAMTDPSAEFIAAKLGSLDLNEIRFELDQKAQMGALKAANAKESASLALSDSPTYSGPGFTSEQIKNLTPEQVARLSPEQIRTMSPEARAALKVDQLSAAQRLALDEAKGLGVDGGGVLSGGMPYGLWYWPLGQLFAFDNGRFALTGPYWDVWCGDILLDGFELDAAPYDDLVDPNESHFEFKVALVTPLDGQPNPFDPKGLEQLIKPQPPAPGPRPTQSPTPTPTLPGPPPPQQPTATPTSIATATLIATPTATPVGPTPTPMATPTRTPTSTPLPPTPTPTPTATSPSQVTLMVSPLRREVEHIRGGDSCPMEIGDFRFTQSGGSGDVMLRRVGALPAWLSLTQVGGGSSLPITLDADFTCQGVPAGEPDLRIEIQFEAVRNGGVVDTESIEIVVHVRSSGA